MSGANLQEQEEQGLISLDTVLNVQSEIRHAIERIKTEKTAIVFSRNSQQGNSIEYPTLKNSSALATVKHKSKEFYENWTLSEVITQLDKLGKNYDQQQYKILTHDIENFLSNLQYTISKNFSTDTELMATLPNILNEIDDIQAKLAVIHNSSVEQQSAQISSIDPQKKSKF